MLKNLVNVGDTLNDSGVFKVTSILREMEITPRLHKTALKVFQGGQYYFLDVLYSPTQKNKFYMMEGEEYSLTTDGSFDGAKIEKTEFQKKDGTKTQMLQAKFMNLVPKNTPVNVSTIDIERKLERYGAHFGYTPTVQDKVLLSALIGARIVGKKEVGEPVDVPTYTKKSKPKSAHADYGEDLPF